MTDPITPLRNLKIPSQELPKAGERVRVVVIKEMIYAGNLDNNSADWLDDGHGQRSILFWESI